MKNWITDFLAISHLNDIFANLAHLFLDLLNISCYKAFNDIFPVIPSRSLIFSICDLYFGQADVWRAFPSQQFGFRLFPCEDLLVQNWCSLSTFVCFYQYLKDQVWCNSFSTCSVRNVLRLKYWIWTSRCLEGFCLHSQQFDSIFFFPSQHL